MIETDDLTDRTDEIANANLCLMLSRVFSSPLTMDETHAEQLRSLVPVLSDDLQGPASALAEAWAAALTEHSDKFSLAYARLFLGPFQILAPPYASFYLEENQSIMGDVSNHVSHAYSAAGLEPGEGPREAPDHVALEWEFIYYLSHQYVVTGEPIWTERRSEFVSTHLALWMPAFAQAMLKAAVHPFYDAAADLVLRIMHEFGHEPDIEP